MRWHRYASIKQSSASHITSVAFSLDGASVASGGEQVTLWDAANGEKRFTLKGHERHVTAVAFSPDGKTLASADWYGIRFWNIGSKKQEAEIRWGGWILCMAISPDGKQLITGGATMLQRWELPSRRHINSYALVDQCSSISFLPASETFACSDGQQIDIWTVESSTMKRDRILEPHRGEVRSVAFSRDGKTLASGGEDRSIKLWSGKNYSEISSIEESHKSGVNCVCFSPDGRFLASGGNDGTAKIWDWESRRELASLSTAQSTARSRRSNASVKSISFSPDGNRIAIGGSNPTHLQLWNLEDEKE